MKSKRTQAFRQYYDALPSSVQKQAVKAYVLFRANPNHPSLNFKPIGGDPVWYSIRVGLGYRAVCFRADDGSYIWFWIGSHTGYDSLLKQR